MKKLIYFAHTILNLKYAISVVNQFIHDPRMRHLQFVDCILRYLKSTPKRRLLFKRGGTQTPTFLIPHWTMLHLQDIVQFRCGSLPQFCSLKKTYYWAEECECYILITWTLNYHFFYLQKQQLNF